MYIGYILLKKSPYAYIYVAIDLLESLLRKHQKKSYCAHLCLVYLFQ